MKKLVATMWSVSLAIAILSWTSGASNPEWIEVCLPLAGVTMYAWENVFRK